MSYFSVAVLLFYLVITPLRSQKCSHLDNTLHSHSTCGSDFEIYGLHFESLVERSSQWLVLPVRGSEILNKVASFYDFTVYAL